MAVGLQGSIEVATLPVHVDIQRIETGPPGIERRRHHHASLIQQILNAPCCQPPGRMSTVDASSPQRFVGIDIAHPRNERLIQERSLDLGSPCSNLGDEGDIVKVRVKWITCDVSDRSGQVTAAIIADQFGNLQAAKGALVDEAQLRSIISESDTNS